MLDDGRRGGVLVPRGCRNDGSEEGSEWCCLASLESNKCPRGEGREGGGGIQIIQKAKFLKSDLDRWILDGWYAQKKLIFTERASELQKGSTPTTILGARRSRTEV